MKTIYISGWSNGSCPEDFGWVIDGQKFTAYDLHQHTGSWEDIRKYLGDPLVDAIIEMGLGDDLSYFDQYMQDQFNGKKPVAVEVKKGKLCPRCKGTGEDPVQTRADRDPRGRPQRMTGGGKEELAPCPYCYGSGEEQ